MDDIAKLYDTAIGENNVENTQILEVIKEAIKEIEKLQTE